MSARPIRVLILASHYRADHVARMRLYHRPNPTASTWNTALFSELGKLDVELHIVQFYPVFRTHIIREDNVTYYYLPRVPKLDGFTSFFKWLRVGRLACKLRTDVIHGIGSEHGYAWAAVHRRWPSVVTIHGYMKNIVRLKGHQSMLKSLFLVREEAAALKHCTRIIAINGFMRDTFTRDGYDADKLHIVPNAINGIYLEGCNAGERDIDVLMVGTLHPLKNQHVALDIFARMRIDLGRSPVVKIVGAPTTESGDYYEQLLALQKRQGLTNVEFTGRKDPTQLKLLYCRSRVLLHISEFETDSLVVAEALGCGVVPAVNPVAGLAHRVHEQINGYHINIKESSAAARQLAAILDDQARLAGLAQRGREVMAAERSSKAVAHATMKIYRQVSAASRDVLPSSNKGSM